MRKYREHKEYDTKEIAKLIRLLNSEEMLSEEVRDEIVYLLLSEQYAEAVDKALADVWEESGRKVFTPEQKMVEKQITLAGIAEKCVDFPVKPLAGTKTIGRKPLRKRLLFQVAAVLLPLLFLVGMLAMLLNGWGDSGANEFWADAVTDDRDVPEQLVFEALNDNMNLNLPDGTSIRLEKGAKVEYAADFMANRVVTLHGTAFFTVTKLNGQPFEVHHNTTKIRVLGTTFYVSDRSAATEVTLCSGSVEVAVAGANVLLQPGQQFVTDLNGAEYSVVELSEAKIARIQHGKLRLQGVSLAEALQKTGEFFDIPIKISSLGVAEPIWMEFGFGNELEEVLLVLRAISGYAFDYEINEEYVEIHD